MSKIDSIKADLKTIMTDELVRAFRLSGCDPECHCCQKNILIGDTFTLSEINDPELEELKDEMLCIACTPDMLLKERRRQKELVKREREKYAREKIAQGGHGYSRKHQL